MVQVVGGFVDQTGSPDGELVSLDTSEGITGKDGCECSNCLLKN